MVGSNALGVISNIELLLSSLSEMEKLAAKLAVHLKAGDLITLRGDLGAGKSALSRAIIRSMMGNQNTEVPSPTFTLLQEYDTPKGLRIHHGDLYRLSDSSELFELGLEEGRFTAVTLIEWPEKLPQSWLVNALDIAMEIMPELDENLENYRKLIVTIPPERPELADVFDMWGQ